VVLKGAEEFNRFALLLQIIHKVSRYARAMDAGHVDSLDDIAVYAQMLQEYDEECKYPADIITHVDFGPAEDLMQASDNVTELRGG
jgi:hypothetical protein